MISAYGLSTSKRLIIWKLYLFESHSDAGDGVIVRAALKRREHSEVDLLLQIVHDLFALLIHRASALTIEDKPRPVGGARPGGGARPEESDQREKSQTRGGGARPQEGEGPDQRERSQTTRGGARAEEEEPDHKRRGQTTRGGARPEEEKPDQRRRSQTRRGGARPEEEKPDHRRRSQTRRGGARPEEEKRLMEITRKTPLLKYAVCVLYALRSAFMQQPDHLLHFLKMCSAYFMRSHHAMC